MRIPGHLQITMRIPVCVKVIGHLGDIRILTDHSEDTSLCIGYWWWDTYRSHCVYSIAFLTHFNLCQDMFVCLIFTDVMYCIFLNYKQSTYESIFVNSFFSVVSSFICTLVIVIIYYLFITDIEKGASSTRHYIVSLKRSLGLTHPHLVLAVTAATLSPPFSP